MFKRFGQRFRKGKQETKLNEQRELSADLVVQDSTMQQAPSDSLRSLLKAAIADAEQIASSIKMRAQTEAEAEAARIIAQAKLEAQKIKGSIEIAAQKQAEDIISAAKRKAGITEIEVKQKAQEDALVEKLEEPARTQKEASEKKVKKLFGLGGKHFGRKGEESVQLEGKAVENKIKQPIQLDKKVEKFIQPQEAALKEEVEEPVQVEKEAAISEPVKGEMEELSGGNLKEERESRKKSEPAVVQADSQALYTGEVELTIASPVELQLVSRLYNYLQTVPELRILYTRGSWDRGTTITVVPDKPMPLIDFILKTPGVEVIPELLEKEGQTTERPGALRRGEKGLKRIKLTLKEAPSP